MNRALITRLPSLSHGFSSRGVHVCFEMDKVALGQVSFRVLQFFPASHHSTDVSYGGGGGMVHYTCLRSQCQGTLSQPYMLGSVKLSLCFIKYHAMKKHPLLNLPPTYWGEEVELHAFLIWALDRGEWLASRSGCFTLVPIWWEAGWAPEPVWTRWREEKVPSLPLPGIEPGTSSL
jgi:hypothetical protein